MVTAELTVSLKPSNKSLVQGCPGVPKTYPTISGTIELRSTSQLPQPINSIHINFVTIDTLKSKPRDVPPSLKKINYELVQNINDRVVSMDVPFMIGIKNEIAPTSDGLRSSTHHKLEVHVSSGKVFKTFEFPVVITTYDTLPLYRQFNEPISKVVDSKDTHAMCEYSLPTSAIGPNEDLLVNLRISTNPAYNKLVDKVKLKKITMELVEIFDCRCDKSFIKESCISNSSKDYGNVFLGVRGLSDSLSIKLLDSQDRYKLFVKHQDVRLLNKPILNSLETTRNELKPLIVEHTDDPIPFTHHQAMTKRSNLFSTYYELRMLLKLSGAKDISISQPITIAPFDRSKSIYLLKWIMKESELADNLLRNIERELGKIGYDSRFDTLKYPQRKPSKMKSKEDKEQFI